MSRFIHFLIGWVVSITIFLYLVAFFTLPKIKTTVPHTVHGSTFLPGMSQVAVPALCIYMVGISIGFGCIPWFMVAELCPRSVQAWANSSIILYNYLLSFLITKCFIGSVDLFGHAVTFAFFATSCFIGVVFIYTLVPETKNKSSSEIQLSIQLGPKKAKKYFMSKS